MPLYLFFYSFLHSSKNIPPTQPLRPQMHLLFLTLWLRGVQDFLSYKKEQRCEWSFHDLCLVLKHFQERACDHFILNVHFSTGE